MHKQENSTPLKKTIKKNKWKFSNWNEAQFTDIKHFVIFW